MCPDAYLVCMYGGDRVLVRCSLVGIAPTHNAVSGRSGFLFRWSIVSRWCLYKIRRISY